MPYDFEPPMGVQGLKNGGAKANTAAAAAVGKMFAKIDEAVAAGKIKPETGAAMKEYAGMKEGGGESISGGTEGANNPTFPLPYQPQPNAGAVGVAPPPPVAKKPTPKWDAIVAPILAPPTATIEGQQPSMTGGPPGQGVAVAPIVMEANQKPPTSAVAKRAALMGRRQQLIARINEQKQSFAQQQAQTASELAAVDGEIASLA